MIIKIPTRMEIRPPVASAGVDLIVIRELTVPPSPSLLYLNVPKTAYLGAHNHALGTKKCGKPFLASHTFQTIEVFLTVSPLRGCRGYRRQTLQLENQAVATGDLVSTTGPSESFMIE